MFTHHRCVCAVCCDLISYLHPCLYLLFAQAFQNSHRSCISFMAFEALTEMCDKRGANAMWYQTGNCCPWYRCKEWCCWKLHGEKLKLKSWCLDTTKLVYTNIINCGLKGESHVSHSCLKADLHAKVQLEATCYSHATYVHCTRDGTAVFSSTFIHFSLNRRCLTCLHRPPSFTLGLTPPLCVCR